MYIHREGRSFLLIVLLILAAINIALWFLAPHIVLWVFLAISVIVMILFGQFFRIPKRKHFTHERAVVSPADGKVVVIEKVFEDEYLKEERIQVSVFMSPINVHQNKVPISGVVEYYKYHTGQYLVAYHPKSSTLNERNTAVITNASGTKILMRQIAGAVAKRIRFYLKEGQKVEQGQELGFIKFGSRMDIFLPLDADIKVEIGTKTKAGVSVLAYLKEK
jgi:phosphatidylserine decarboxylase